MIYVTGSTDDGEMRSYVRHIVEEVWRSVIPIVYESLQARSRFEQYETAARILRADLKFRDAVTFQIVREIFGGSVVDQPRRVPADAEKAWKSVTHRLKIARNRVAKLSRDGAAPDAIWGDERLRGVWADLREAWQLKGERKMYIRARGRPRLEIAETVVLRLASAYEDATGKKATFVNRNEQDGGPFGELLVLIGDDLRELSRAFGRPNGRFPQSLPRFARSVFQRRT